MQSRGSRRWGIRGCSRGGVLSLRWWEGPRRLGGGLLEPESLAPWKVSCGQLMVHTQLMINPISSHLVPSHPVQVQTHLLENSLLEPPRSCDGEPAPERVLPAILPAFKAPRKGDRWRPSQDRCRWPRWARYSRWTSQSAEGPVVGSPASAGQRAQKMTL